MSDIVEDLFQEWQQARTNVEKARQLSLSYRNALSSAILKEEDARVLENIAWKRYDDARKKEKEFGV